MKSIIKQFQDKLIIYILMMVFNLVNIYIVFNNFFIPKRKNLLFFQWNDSAYYFAKINSVVNGDLLQTQTYFEALTSSVPINQEFVGEIFYGLASKIFSNNISIGYSLSNIILTSIIIWKFCKINNFSETSIIGCASFLVLALLFFPYWFERPVQPLFPLTLIIIYLANRIKFKNLTLIQIFVANLLVFTNIFFALLVYAHIILSNFNVETKLRKITLLIPAPTIYLYFQLTSGAGGNEDRTRWGLVQSHFPGALKETFVGIVVLTFQWAIMRKSATNNSIKIRFDFLILTLLAMNSQIITGKSMEFGAHFGPIVYFLAILLVSFDLVPLILKFTNELRSKLIIVFLILFIFLFRLLHSLNLYQDEQLFIDIKNNVSVLSLKNLNSQIILDSKFSEYVPIYSNYKILYSTSGTTFFSMSNQEVLERRILSEFINTSDIKEFVKTIESDSFIYSTFSRFYLNHNQKIKTEEKFIKNSKLRDFVNNKTIEFRKTRDEILFHNLPDNFNALKFKYKV